MNYTLKKLFIVRTVVISNDVEKLYLKSCLFSNSFYLKDSKGNILATLKRKHWWSNHFSLVTPYAKYQYKYANVSSSYPTLKCIDDQNVYTYRADGFYIDFKRRKGKLTEAHLSGESPMSNYPLGGAIFSLIFKRNYCLNMLTDNEHNTALLACHCFQYMIQPDPAVLL